MVTGNIFHCSDFLKVMKLNNKVNDMMGMNYIRERIMGSTNSTWCSMEEQTTLYTKAFWIFYFTFFSDVQGRDSY